MSNRQRTEDRLLLVADLSRTRYDTCWRLQQDLLELRRTGGVADILLLTEHDHVYTVGAAGGLQHLLLSDTELQASGADVVRSDRGGDITYHGPGQLVVYPILDLQDHRCDLHWYLRMIEEVVISTLARYNIRGSRIPGYTGVWVGHEKICAVGIRTSRWITMHGFALNINTDLTFFESIIPCGIRALGVTSMNKKLGSLLDMPIVSEAIVNDFASLFDMQVRPIGPGELPRLVGGKAGRPVELNQPMREDRG